MADEQTFLILDGHSLAYRAFHALDPAGFQTSSGLYTNAVSGFMSMLATVLREHKPTHIAVAFDVSRDTFRARLYPEYKATRAKTPDEFKGQVEQIKRVLAALNIAVVTADGYEADDILATLAHHSEVPVHILTGDRDSFQLIAPDVLVLYPGQRISDLRALDDAAIREKYGVPADRYRDLAALVGESSDNLPGIPGVGPKTAAKWIAEFGGVEGILANAEAITGKVGEALREHKDAVIRNYELNRLVDDVPIPRAAADYARRAYEPRDFHAVMDELEFGRGDSSVRGRLLTAWPTDADVPAAEPATALAVSAVHVDAGGLATWLGVHGAGRVAVAVDGRAARGRAVVDLVALVAADGSAVWTEYRTTGLLDWLRGETPKVLHDAKTLMLALLADGAVLGGVVVDTAIAAYLVSPGSRTFDLLDLADKYLNVSLVPVKDESGMLFQDDEVSGESLALRARATLDLAEHLERELVERGSADLMRDLELPLVAVLADMEHAGIAVDAAALRALEQSFEDDATAAVRAAHKAAGREFNVGSTKQLQEVLFEDRKLPKTKKTKTGYTTDADALQWLLAQVPEDELLVAILRYREVSKLRQTVTGLLACVTDDGRIHTTFNQMVAATGRLSSIDPNLQNIPVRTEEGGRIRGMFVAGPGYESLLTADYSQIELRVMAHVSGDAALVAALASGEDLHTTVGSQVFGVAPQDVTADMRRQIKAMSYGLAYGLSAFGLAGQLGISTGAAKALMDTYFERFGGVRDYLASVVAQARKVGYTESIMGRRRYLPDLNAPDRQVREAAERMALNAPIQGSAADIVKLAMLGVHRGLAQAGLASRLLLQVHDELIVEVAPGEAKLVEELVRSCMGSAVDLAVPLDVSVGIGRSWADAAH